jgi:hypothetical protein
MITQKDFLSRKWRKADMVIQYFAWEGPLPLQKVATQLKATLFGPIEKQVTSEALRAEVIRVTLWEQSVLSRPRTVSDASITTQQLLSRARTLWTPLHLAMQQVTSSQSADGEDREQQPEEEELNRQTLDTLAEQGDLLALPQGRWLPAPLRLVPITSELYLLVGALPSSLLPSPVLQSLHLHGCFRRVERRVIQTVSQFDEYECWQFQTQESWLGAPPPKQAELLERFRDTELYPVAQQSATESLEAYVASINKPQGLRWRSSIHVPEDGRYLLRNRTPWGKIFYSIGEIQKRQIKRQSQMQESFDIRRLCYALDSDARVPTRARWDREQGILTLKSELPARERKYLATFGHLQKNNQYYYPRIWKIAAQHEIEIKELLSHLGVLIEDIK